MRENAISLTDLKTALDQLDTAMTPLLRTAAEGSDMPPSPAEALNPAIRNLRATLETATPCSSAPAPLEV